MTRGRNVSKSKQRGIRSNPQSILMEGSNGVSRNTSTVKLLTPDPWSLPDIPLAEKWNWMELTRKEKTKRIVFIILKCAILISCMYGFICSLGLISISFRLVAGKVTGSIFKDVDLLRNPVVGVMIGVLSTVILQSSSTFTSIIVSMVAAGVLTVEDAIPVIMGANIGTSITNSIVSIAHMTDKIVFRRAFAAATIHDIFNWLSVIVLLPLEMCTGYLNRITGLITQGIGQHEKISQFKFLKVLTDPVLNHIIQIDKNVIKSWTTGSDADRSPEQAKYINYTSLIKRECQNANEDSSLNSSSQCLFLFANASMKDEVVGIVLLVFSLLVLCLCLVTIVKVLVSMLKGYIGGIIKKILNGNIPYVPWLTGYVAIIIGCILTIFVQSSSVFTSTLTPFAGIGLISLDRVYPLTLGSNIGTTTTAILAAFAAADENFKHSIQVALCHLFFNFTGVLLFYVFPVTRFPIPLAKMLGNTTAKYRWFALLYLFAMFLFLPTFVFALSLGGPIVLGSVGGIFVIFLLFAIIVNILQSSNPKVLPMVLQSWNFLPLWMHSLDPLDALIVKMTCCNKFTESKEEIEKFLNPLGPELDLENPRTFTEQHV